MNDDAEPLAFAGLMRRTAGHIASHLEVFGLLVLLWAILATLVVAPFMDELQRFQEVGPENPEAAVEAFRALLPGILLMVGGGVLLSSAFYLIWARALGAGRHAVFAEGFVRRYLLILWRNISLLGYLLLVLVGVILATLLLSVLLPLIGIPAMAGGKASGGLEIILTLVVLAAVVPLVLGFLVSVSATALDDPRGILQSMQALKGRWWPLVGIFIVIYLATGLAAALVAAPFAEAGATPSFLAILLQTVIGVAGGLFIVTAAYTVYARIRAAERSQE